MSAEGSSRPGPRTDLDAREMLLDAAERLYGTNGVGTDSLRAIGREAGVSPAGVLYHFPTKTALLEAVVQRRGEATTAQMRADLQLLVDKEGPVATREVVDAVLSPFVDLISAEPTAGLHWVKVITQLANNQDEAWSVLLGGEPSAVELFHAAATRALPDYASDAVFFRVSIAMYSLLGSLASADQGEPVGKLGPDGLNPVFVEELAKFTASGMAAR